MSINWLTKKMFFIILLIFLFSFELQSSSSRFFSSCNYYLSPRNCRSCMVDIMVDVNKFDIIDTLFIIYPKGDSIQKQNLLRIFKRHWNQKIIGDTVFGEFEGDLFDTKAKTNFGDSSLNSLFNLSTPLLFIRDNHRVRIISN